MQQPGDHQRDTRDRIGFEPAIHSASVSTPGGNGGRIEAGERRGSGRD